MAVQVYKDQKIWLDGLDLTGNTNAIGLEIGNETEDDTTFGDNTRSNVPGLPVVTASMDGLVETATSDKALFDAVGVLNAPLSFGADANVGSPVYAFPALIGSYSPEGEVGRLFRYSASAAGRGEVVRGTIMENLVGRATSGNSGILQLGAVAADQRLYAALHVLKVDNPADTIAVIVESAPTVGFAAPTQRLAFNQASAPGGQWITPDPPVAITDTWWRVGFTIAGTTPAFDFVAILGIF